MNNIQYINENLALIQVLHKCVSSSRVQRDWVREYACTHITRAYTAACWSTVVHSCLLEYSRQETRIQATNTSCTKKMLLPGNHVATRLKLICLFDSWVAALFQTLFCYCQSSVLLRRPIDEDHAKYKKITVFEWRDVPCIKKIQISPLKRLCIYYWLILFTIHLLAINCEAGFSSSTNFHRHWRETFLEFFIQPESLTLLPHLVKNNNNNPEAHKDIYL